MLSGFQAFEIVHEIYFLDLSVHYNLTSKVSDLQSKYTKVTELPRSSIARSCDIHDDYNVGRMELCKLAIRSILKLKVPQFVSRRRGGRS
jgi:hypothetical protein